METGPSVELIGLLYAFNFELALLLRLFLTTDQIKLVACCCLAE